MQWLVIFIVMLAVVGLMAIGILFKRKPLAGTCGGIANLGISKSCDFCGKKTEDCPRRHASGSSVSNNSVESHQSLKS